MPTCRHERKAALRASWRISLYTWLRSLGEQRCSTRERGCPPFHGLGFYEGKRSGWRWCVGLEGTPPPADIVPGAQFVAYPMIDSDGAHAHRLMQGHTRWIWEGDPGIDPIKALLAQKSKQRGIQGALATPFFVEVHRNLDGPLVGSTRSIRTGMGIADRQPMRFVYYPGMREQFLFNALSHLLNPRRDQFEGGGVDVTTGA